jgi:hypothetical protein
LERISELYETYKHWNGIQCGKMKKSSLGNFWEMPYDCYIYIIDEELIYHEDQEKFCQ